jgi:hypothetical protein
MLPLVIRSGVGLFPRGGRLSLTGVERVRMPRRDNIPKGRAWFKPGEDPN